MSLDAANTGARREAGTADVARGCGTVGVSARRPATGRSWEAAARRGVAAARRADVARLFGDLRR